VSGGRDTATGATVHSLYGSAYKPTPDMLKGLDVLVFDIQDIGTRFYTYISTMGLSMQAAAAAGLPFVVLDRPNPLGGEDVSGFVLEKPFASFVGRYPIPVVHGLSIGELARMIAGERLLAGLERLSLDVVPMDGWRRGMRWPATGLPWVATSPNIPTFETALAYAGTGLFEATVASEGRGTDTPFELIGAPWIDAQEFAAALNAAKLPGVRFTPIEFTPNDSKFKDQKCGGVNVAITDQAKFESVAVGMEIAATLRKLYPLDWQVKRADRLLINKEVFDAIVAGADREEIEALYQDDLEKFRDRREEFLLYAD